ncbi:predicted protein [Scheffersomyces stipitis CBS 6054]|uniref:Uncharacterized protein n=1 Tax=Scheffersomyces stipitis (strain ATCC 58785 / CBS 6054 / NBRC 10063 / NRRL Y-11545) TaxID=322104 RepID=A3LWF2_PICST|nr:predicted protein [Scheffersomyces stipitis CBS 6054]ABN67268.2 predicted protein [Scheffersomyces stipitis CBS 6054]
MKYRYVRAYENSSINSFCVVPGTTSSDLVLTGGGNDFRIKLFKLEVQDYQQSQLVFPTYHTNSINALDCSQAGDFFISASQHKIVAIDMVTQKKICQLTNTPVSIRDEVLDCKLLNDNLVASCGVSHHLNLFDLRQSTYKAIFSINMGNDNLNSLDCNRVMGTNEFDFTTDSASVGSSNGNLYTVDFRNQQLITDSFSELGSIMAVSRKGETRSLITLGDGSVVGFDNRENKRAWSFNRGSSLNYKLNSDTIPQFKYVITCSETGQLHTYTHEGRLVRSLTIPSLDSSIGDSPEALLLNIVHYQKEQNRILSTSGNGIIHLWDDVFS